MDSSPAVLSAAGVAAVLTLWLAARKVNDVIVDQTTCLPDLANLGVPTKSKYAGRAIVCGGSYAGLMAARMLTDHFDEVVVIESEATFEDGGRKGTHVMQYNQLHAFGTLGLTCWRKMWPETDEEVRRADGRITQLNNNYYIGRRADVPKDFPLEWVMFCRPTAETVVRRLARRHPRIKFIDGFVTGLTVPEKGERRVNGVTYRPNVSEVPDAEDKLEAALVIDAAGLACRGVKWLEKIGYPAPRRDFYDPFGAYTTAVVKLTPEVIAKVPWPKPYAEIGWIVATPAEAGFCQRSTYITRWDGDRISFLLSVFNNLEPTPQTRTEVYEWVRSCTLEPWQYTLLDILDAEIDDMEIHRTKLGQFYHQRYDLQKDLPEGFVAISDAVMKLNPVYGQGGTKAAADVCTLDGVLRRGRKGRSPYEPLPKKIFKTFLTKHTPRANAMMDFDKAIDYAWGNTVLFPGEKVNDRAAVLWWWRQVAQAMSYSPPVAGKVQAIMQSMAPPTQLFSPVVLWTVLLYKLSVFGSGKTDAKKGQ